MNTGGLSLGDLIEVGPTGHEHEWEKVWKINRHELMPPADEDQPTLEERRRINEWVLQKMLGVDYDNPDPGPVTIRRLNRMGVNAESVGDSTGRLEDI